MICVNSDDKYALNVEHRMRKVETSEVSMGNDLSQISVSRLWISVSSLEKPSCEMCESKDQCSESGRASEVRTSNSRLHLPGPTSSRSSRRE